MYKVMTTVIDGAESGPWSIVDTETGSQGSFFRYVVPIAEMDLPVGDRRIVTSLRLYSDWRAGFLIHLEGAEQLCLDGIPVAPTVIVTYHGIYVKTAAGSSTKNAIAGPAVDVSREGTLRITDRGGNSAPYIKICGVNEVGTLAKRLSPGTGPAIVADDVIRVAQALAEHV